MKHDDSGPAFPSMESWDQWSEEKADYVQCAVQTGGMTLRDYFAGQALMGMHARDTFDQGLASPQDRARNAYLDAEAMLAERAK